MWSGLQGIHYAGQNPLPVLILDPLLLGASVVIQPFWVNVIHCIHYGVVYLLGRFRHCPYEFLPGFT